MVTVYIDVTLHDYNLAHFPGVNKSSFGYFTSRIEELVQRPVKFICNLTAGLSRGDVYAIICKDSADATFFILSSQFNILDSTKITAHLNRQYRETTQREFQDWVLRNAPVKF